LSRLSTASVTPTSLRASPRRAERR
jgi:hypothetical protein